MLNFSKTWWLVSKISSCFEFVGITNSQNLQCGSKYRNIRRYSSLLQLIFFQSRQILNRKIMCNYWRLFHARLFLCHRCHESQCHLPTESPMAEIITAVFKKCQRFKSTRAADVLKPLRSWNLLCKAHQEVTSGYKHADTSVHHTAKHFKNTTLPSFWKVKLKY